MNFSPFGSPFQTTLPPMHQFASKFTDPVIVNNSGMISGQNALMVTSLSGDGTSGGIQYLPSSTTSSSVTQLQSVSSVSRIATLSSNIQVVNSSGSNSKYSPGTALIGWDNVPVHHFTTVDPKVVSAIPYNPQSNVISNSSPPTAMWPVRLITADSEFTDSEPQDLCKPLKEEREIKEEKEEDKLEVIPLQIPLQAAWPEGSGTVAVADYISRLPTSSIPISLHHFLKYSSDSMKKEGFMQELTLISDQPLPDHGEIQEQPADNQTSIPRDEIENSPAQGKTKRKKKQKVKEKKPRYKPGEIRLSTALDGSTLFCCPECNMAYPERFSLEQHLSDHKLERRFVCDVCGAGLKRKEHLDQHKKGHSQERPFVCSICTKGFKRNEHLTRHYVIHSGEKTYVCGECNKAFSRKDHLHKHTQTHITKRVKAEMSSQNLPLTPSVPVPAPVVVVNN